MSIYDNLIPIIATTDHPTVRLVPVIESCDEGHVLKIVWPLIAAITDEATPYAERAEARQIARDLVRQLLDAENMGFIPCLIKPPGSTTGWHPSVNRNANCGCQFDDKAYRCVLTAIRSLAPHVGEYEPLAWAMYGRCLGFVRRVISQTQARGLPHTVNCDGVSIQSRKWEPAGILNVMDSADMHQECVIALRDVPDEHHGSLNAIKDSLWLFLKATRAIGTLGGDEWPRYVWDGNPADPNELNIYDPPESVSIGRRGSWPIQWAGFEAGGSA